MDTKKSVTLPALKAHPEIRPPRAPTVLYMRAPISRDIELMMDDAKGALNLALTNIKQSITTQIQQSPSEPIPTSTLKTLRECISALKDLKNMETGAVEHALELNDLTKLSDTELDALSK